jgi:hypothetical protein
MNWQIFLTAWLLVQLITSTVRAVRYCRLLGKNENDVIAGAIGNTVRIVGIFLCLWAGGFYTT